MSNKQYEKVRIDLTDDEFIKEEFKFCNILLIGDFDFFFVRSLIMNTIISRGNFVLTKDAVTVRYENHSGLSKIGKDFPNLDKHQDLKNDFKFNTENKIKETKQDQLLEKPIESLLYFDDIDDDGTIN